MSNVLSEEKKQQILALGRLGWSLRRIERATGVRRETASAYLKEAGVVVSGPGRQGRRPAAKPAIEVTTDSDSAKPANGETTGGIHEASRESEAEPREESSRSPIASACEIFREVIELWLTQGRNAMAIWQDLVSHHGFSGGYQSVKRFVRKLRGPQTREACGIITTAPGEECQVDYGKGPMVRNPDTGKYRRTRLFMLTLGYSRKAVRILVFRSSTRTWAELHERAFGKLGGSNPGVVSR